MSARDSHKGNGAHKRMSNERRKARRQRCWQRGESRKIQHSRENAARAAQNRILRAQGEPTPWELATELRKERRAMLREEALRVSSAPGGRS